MFLQKNKQAYDKCVLELKKDKTDKASKPELFYLKLHYINNVEERVFSLKTKTFQRKFLLQPH